MVKIDKNKRKFTSKEVLQDKAKFALIMQIIESAIAEIYPSNKAYINADYEDTGVLINFSCFRKPIRQI